MKEFLGAQPQCWVRGAAEASPPEIHFPETDVRLRVYEMRGYLQNAVAKYCELAGISEKKLPKVGTPFLDESKEKESEEPEKGKLADNAAKVLMTFMYASRIARPDTLRAVTALASEITRWTTLCDKKLHRLVSYVHHTYNQCQVGWVGDEPSKIHLALFCDADFAGDRGSRHSTTGVFSALVGPSTFFPVAAISRTQNATAHSSTEAELLAADVGLKAVGIPLLDLWERVAGKPVALKLFEDNQAASRIMETGKYPTMRHVERVHGVSLNFLHEMYQRKVFSLEDCHTMAQAADVFTKPITSFITWSRSMLMIGMHYDLEECSKTSGVCVESSSSDVDSNSPRHAAAAQVQVRARASAIPPARFLFLPTWFRASGQIISRRALGGDTCAGKGSLGGDACDNGVSLGELDSVVSKSVAASLQQGSVLGTCGGDP